MRIRPKGEGVYLSYVGIIGQHMHFDCSLCSSCLHWHFDDSNGSIFVKNVFNGETSTLNVNHLNIHKMAQNKSLFALFQRAFIMTKIDFLILISIPVGGAKQGNILRQEWFMLVCRDSRPQCYRSDIWKGSCATHEGLQCGNVRDLPPLICGVGAYICASWLTCHFCFGSRC